jgi:plasmid stabilization system protein ParE
VKLVIAEAAEREIAEALAFIGQDDPLAARRLNETIQGAIRDVLAFPRSGARMRSGQRRFQVRGTPFRLVYRVSRDAIIILRVWHGARQWPPARD